MLKVRCLPINDQCMKTSEMAKLIGRNYTIHFRDARLWSNAGLLRNKVSKITSVVDTIRSQVLLEGRDYAAFTECLASSQLQGFPAHYSVPSLADLHELLGENWIGERIIDAQEYQVMKTINERRGASTITIFPTIFHTQLTVAYLAKTFSMSLKTLRGSLLANLPRFIAFVFNKDLCHWAPCIVSLDDRVVWQGDSLRWNPDANMLAKIRWLLGDITNASGEWTEKILDVPRQGSASGSCGVIAMNSIERHLLADVLPWIPSLSTQFRHRWLAELVLFHLKAIQSSKEVCIGIPLVERY
jgi:hypothetical protein